MLQLDGVYVEEGGRSRFVPLVLSPGDVGWLVLRIRRRVLAWLGRRGLLPAEEGGDLDGGEEELFAWWEGAAMRGRIALGPRAGWRVERLGGEEVRMAPLGVLCAEADGFNVHAGVRVIAGRRERLRALCRYLLRPPLCAERLSWTPDGRILLRLKRPWADGTNALCFEALDFVAKLAALVHPPRRHLVVYAGVLSGHARDRAEVVPAGRSSVDACGCPAPAPSPAAPRPVPNRAEPAAGAPAPSPGRDTPARRQSGLLWAELLRRSFGFDALRCSCGGRMRLLCCVTNPDALEAIARSLGRTTPPPRPPPSRELFVEPA